MQNLQFYINIFILTKSDATMKIEFSWDEHKAEINLKKHGVAFEDATLVFMMLMPYKSLLKSKQVFITKTP